MQTYQKKLGNFGEKIAEKYLNTKGYTIIYKNYRKRVGEIDLVAQKDNKTIFIEVKTRTSYKFGYPEEAIDQYKLEKLSNVIDEYLLENKLPPDNIQLDCLIIEFGHNSRKIKIRHIKNIDLD